jgi:hypothetical protein
VKHFLLFFLAALFLTGCEYEEVERETGYKGKARMNPWLAAERLAERMGEDVVSVIAWTEPEAGDSAWLMPVTMLGNESFTLRMEEWVNGGGHLILMAEYADAQTNDWLGRHSPPVVEPALDAMLGRARLHLHKNSRVSARKIRFGDETFKVDASSGYAVSKGNGKNGVFATTRLGEGRITVITDGRIFRNRWIAENDHAALLTALIEASEYEGRVGFMRGAGLSLWSLLREHLTPVLLVLAAWLVLWLWKSLSRFGPLESATPPPLLRGYGRHLEALGHFHWKLDHAATLLPPLREQVHEFGHRACISSGRGAGELHAFLAERSGLPEERISRVLLETPPSDPASLTRITADLQKLLQVLNHPSMS